MLFRKPKDEIKLEEEEDKDLSLEEQVDQVTETVEEIKKQLAELVSDQFKSMKAEIEFWRKAFMGRVEHSEDMLAKMIERPPPERPKTATELYAEKKAAQEAANSNSGNFKGGFAAMDNKAKK